MDLRGFWKDRLVWLSEFHLRSWAWAVMMVNNFYISALGTDLLPCSEWRWKQVEVVVDPRQMDPTRHPWPYPPLRHSVVVAPHSHVQARVVELPSLLLRAVFVSSRPCISIITKDETLTQTPSAQE